MIFIFNFKKYSIFYTWYVSLKHFGIAYVIDFVNTTINIQDNSGCGITPNKITLM